MDMSIKEERSLFARLSSPEGFTSVSHVFVMEWAAVFRDIVGGLLIAGALGAWVPDSFWQRIFFTGHPVLAKISGPLLGPIISIFAFVCSIGNVPLAAVLWNGGISFGGVISFIFADLIILPMLVIYRKYYGTKMMLFILATFYVTMVLAGYAVELIFGAVGLIPATRNAKVLNPTISWNYTTYLNIVFIVAGVVLVWRFFSTGGGTMLKMMGGSPESADMGSMCGQPPRFALLAHSPGHAGPSNIRTSPLFSRSTAPASEGASIVSNREREQSLNQLPAENGRLRTGHRAGGHGRRQSPRSARRIDRSAGCSCQISRGLGLLAHGLRYGLATESPEFLLSNPIAWTTQPI